MFEFGCSVPTLPINCIPVIAKNISARHKIQIAARQPMSVTSLAHNGLKIAPPIPLKAMANPVGVPGDSGNTWLKILGMATIPRHPETPARIEDMYQISPPGCTVISK